MEKSKETVLRYLETFKEIEEILKKIGDDNKSFAYNLNHFQYKPIIKPFYRDLLTHKEIRNLLAHNSMGIFPNEETLNNLIKIKNTLKSPFLVYELIKNKPHKLEDKTSVLQIMADIKDMNYSQFPVYEDKKFIGLITSNCIARWLASKVDISGEILFDLSESKARDVIEFKEELDDAKFISRSMNIYEFFDQMDNKTSVWIITETGNKNEEPLSIVTQYDFDKIISKTKVS